MSQSPVAVQQAVDAIHRATERANQRENVQELLDDLIRAVRIDDAELAYELVGECEHCTTARIIYQNLRDRANEGSAA